MVLGEKVGKFSQYFQTGEERPEKGNGGTT